MRHLVVCPQKAARPAISACLYFLLDCMYLGTHWETTCISWGAALQAAQLLQYSWVRTTWNGLNLTEFTEFVNNQTKSVTRLSNKRLQNRQKCHFWGFFFNISQYAQTSRILQSWEVILSAIFGSFILLYLIHLEVIL